MNDGGLDLHNRIKIAQRDFEDTKLLFENKRYPNAIFMLQQSIEKEIKSLLIKRSLVGIEKELRTKINHYVASNLVELLIEKEYSFVESICETFSNEADRSKYKNKLLPKEIEKAISTRLSNIVSTIKNNAFSKVNKELNDKISQLITEFT